MEAALLVEGIGGWRGFDDIEEHLILDELLLLHESLKHSKHENYRVLGSFQGIEVPELESESVGQDDLPPEVLEMEREFAKKKAEHLRGNSDVENPLGDGFGYKKV